MIDSEAPNVSYPLIDSYIYSGKTTSVNATITDENTITAWISFNQTISNSTMSNVSATMFTGNFVAPAIGIYIFGLTVCCDDPLVIPENYAFV